MTLHTGTSCTIESSGFAGTLISDDCDAYDNGNAGCAIQAKSTNSYGAGFDANGEGGVYAMEWTDSAISVYWWLADNVPSDITDGAPDPSGWGTPPAKFVPSCSIADNFADHSIVSFVFYFPFRFLSFPPITRSLPFFFIPIDL